MSEKEPRKLHLVKECNQKRLVMSINERLEIEYNSNLKFKQNQAKKS